MAVLKLTQDGFPDSWLSHQGAATLIAKDQVCWSLGEKLTTLYGGSSNNGEQSLLDIPAIIATKGQRQRSSFTPPLSNTLLFRRDEFRCLYCGLGFTRYELSRDHIIPKGQGGRDVWTNIATACKRCNHAKGCRTPEQANMPLLAVPFTPNPFEFMYLAAHKIQGDQWDYLSARWSDRRCWVA